MMIISATARVAPLALVLTFLAAPAVAEPTLAISPRAGHPQQALRVSGSGFSPGAAVDIYFDTKDKLLVHADASGSFKGQRLRIPAAALPGTHWITAVGRRHRDHAQRAVTVSTSWAERGFDASGAGYNPYENVINAGNVDSLKPAWVARPNEGEHTGTLLAYSNGKVFFTAYDSLPQIQQSHVYAVDAKTGASVWVASVMDSLSSPAVANGKVYVGGGDGRIYALDASSGEVVWAVFIAGVSSSPAVANGVVYIGGSEVYALDGKTGAVLWSTPTGASGYLKSSPAVADEVVYIGSLDSKLYALNAKTGAVLWTAMTVTGIQSPVVVADGIVYVMSGNKLYAFGAADGRTLWTAPSSSSVYQAGSQSVPAVADGVVYVVDPNLGNGLLYALDAKTGAVRWKAPISRIMQAPVVANGLVYVGSADNKLYAFRSSDGALLWTSELVNVPSPLAVADGTLFVSSGSIFAYAPDGTMNARYQQDTDPPAIATLHRDNHLQFTGSAALN